mmetsp:Transcript_34716/g.99367  ORF Transcript_34716/g.99367 Transcript_34716/m.99367 type:complete len:224 (+) Transcript_34716:938-1609(+)
MHREEALQGRPLEILHDQGRRRWLAVDEDPQLALDEAAHLRAARVDGRCGPELRTARHDLAPHAVGDGLAVPAILINLALPTVRAGLRPVGGARDGPALRGLLGRLGCRPCLDICLAVLICRALVRSGSLWHRRAHLRLGGRSALRSSRRAPGPVALPRTDTAAVAVRGFGDLHRYAISSRLCLCGAPQQGDCGLDGLDTATAAALGKVFVASILGYPDYDRA